MRFTSEYFIDIAIGLVIALAILFGYRFLLKRMQRGRPSQDYAILHNLAEGDASGVVRFFFELPEPQHVRFVLEDHNEKEVRTLKDETVKRGSFVMKFDTATMPNGSYFYKLTTKNQTICKKFTINNPE